MVNSKLRSQIKYLIAVFGMDTYLIQLF
uniref:Uncharacterized protein n=1 Tax=Anguilla anguilla TaxID=7936 RepID=A0A0E9QMA3_ANGAN